MVVKDLVGVVMAVIVVAGLSVVFARGGQGATVLGAGFSGFSQVLQAAEGPAR
jgi:PRD1 phage membrane DNA delivery